VQRTGGALFLLWIVGRSRPVTYSTVTDFARFRG
jgi:hypothetical protein